MTPHPISTSELHAARRRIAEHVHRTPLLSSRQLSQRCGGRVLLKCENLQRTGSFKIRGALNAVLSLGVEERARGVVTYSSGNHGQALALAARIAGVRAVVCMPEGAPRSKVDAARAYGGEVRFAGTTSDERLHAAERAVEAEGLVMVRPFDDPRIVAGQAGVALEILEDAPEVDVVLIPTGGGGLLAGTALAMAAAGRDVAVYAIEPATGNAMGAALAVGRPVAIPPPRSIADGLLPLKVGQLNLDVAAAHGVRAVTVSEEAIGEALRFLISRAKLVVEPSGGAGVAAILAGAIPAGLAGRTIAVVLSGGNVDLASLAAALA
jgi:threonine dehydratase